MADKEFDFTIVDELGGTVYFAQRVDKGTELDFVEW